MIHLICDRDRKTQIPRLIIRMLPKDPRSRQQLQVLFTSHVKIITQVNPSSIYPSNKNALTFYTGAIGAFILGNIIGWSSPVQPQLQQNSTEIFNETSSSDWIAHIILDDNQMSWVGSLPNLGALFGALGAGFLMDKFGRRFVLMTMSLPYLVACLLLAAAANPGNLR